MLQSSGKLCKPSADHQYLPCNGIAGLFLLVVLHSGEEALRLVVKRDTGQMGGVSYELYVLHYPILGVVEAVTHQPLFVVVFGLLLTMVATVIWKRYLEGKVLIAFA